MDANPAPTSTRPSRPPPSEHVRAPINVQSWTIVRPQRVINGIMNRLSEETLEPVTARLRDAYRGHSTTETNEALWMATRAVCVHDKHVRPGPILAGTILPSSGGGYS